MVAEEVTLHGGPKHGQSMAIPSDTNVIPVESFPRMPKPTDGIVAASPIVPRRGQYSRAHGSHDFEWDGWYR